MKGNELADTAAPATEDNSSDTGWDSGEVALPANWWSLEGGFTLASDGISASAAELTVTLFADNDKALKPICSATYTDATLTAVNPTPDASIFHWFDLGADTYTENDCDLERLPDLKRSISFGVGALHSDIRAALGSTRFAGQEARLYGSYISVDASKTIWAYGVSEGSPNEEMTATGPLPAGFYSIEGVYLLPL